MHGAHIVHAALDCSFACAAQDKNATTTRPTRLLGHMSLLHRQLHICKGYKDRDSPFMITSGCLRDLHDCHVSDAIYDQNGADHHRPACACHRTAFWDMVPTYSHPWHACRSDACPRRAMAQSFWHPCALLPQLGLAPISGAQLEHPRSAVAQYFAGQSVGHTCPDVQIRLCHLASKKPLQWFAGELQPAMLLRQPLPLH